MIFHFNQITGLTSMTYMVHLESKVTINHKEKSDDLTGIHARHSS